MDKYEKAQMEVIEFEAEDIITTSSLIVDETEIKFGEGYPPCSSYSG